MDANYGVTYLGTPNKGFTYLDPANSGIFVKGEVRDVKEINTKKGKVIVVARNNDELQIFKKNDKH